MQKYTYTCMRHNNKIETADWNNLTDLWNVMQIYSQGKMDCDTYINSHK